jgi:ATP-dependent DNA helicase RecQ
VSLSVPDQHLSRFGLSAFRSGQRRVLDAVFAGRDCLCIMPTGGGKSLCYQLPAVARPGTVLVVSPLIALMQDQVESLVARGISATFINSSLGIAEQNQRIEAMAAGNYDLVYIAPERMRSRLFVEALSSVQVQLLAIDEAHCISQWGHDFRPDYARLGRLREQIGSPQTIALTATATRTVQNDICDILCLRSPAVFVTGFARDNLALSVATPSSNSARDEMLEQFIKATPGCGIVYCSTRKSCEHVTELLQGRVSRNVATYHAGMDSGSRRNIQESFSSGKIEIIVATNAFGMGIDKSDLRFVLHYNLPGSVEAYYQEAGRAGRDGHPAACHMLYTWQDKFIQEFFIENSYPSREVVKQVYQFLCRCPMDPIEMTLLELQHEVGNQVGSEGIRVSETLLEKAGAIERMDTQQNMASVRIFSNLPTIVDLLPREARAKRKIVQAIESRIGPLRGERFYFLPTEFARQLDTPWETLQKYLRELNQLDCFDYVPAFRGRAIHVLKRIPFEKLEIDFEELQRRKDDEYRRLSSMIAFATSTRCRLQEILDYFGDEEKGDCGRCDNCVSRRAQGGESPATVARQIAGNKGAAYGVQVALSGIARSKGRYGQVLIAQMLCGSASRKVKQSALHHLSTYGLLAELGQNLASELISVLIDGGFAMKEESQRFRPLVSISKRGQGVLRGKYVSEAISLLPADLRKKLNALYKDRDPVLDKDGTAGPGAEGGVDNNVPATIPENTIDPDGMDTLPELDDEPAVVVIPVERVASEIRNVALANGGAEVGNASLKRVDAGHTHSIARGLTLPTWYWTWKLYEMGMTTSEIVQIRGLGIVELEKHIDIARQEGLKVDPGWISRTGREVR